VLIFGLLAPLTASAAPADVPLTTLGAPPINGTLSNGVDWSAATNPGPASGGWVGGFTADGHYQWYPSEGIQKWTFSTPVNLSFVITNLNGYMEGMIMPPGTGCDLSGVDPALASEFSFNPGTATLVHTGPSSTAASHPRIPCWLNNVTELTFDGTGLNQTLTRGMRTLTAAPATLQAQFTGLPSTIKPGQTVQGKLICSNADSGQTPPQTGPDALNVTCDPVVASGGGTLGNVQCLPPTPVAVLKDTESIVCTFDLTAPNTPAVNIELTGTTTADGLFVSTATRSPGGMTSTIWLRSATSTAVPALNPAMLAALALALLMLAAFGRKRRG